MYEMTAPNGSHPSPIPGGMYEVKKDGAMWIVRSTSTGLVQFRSLRRVNCTDWVKANAQGTGGPENG